MRRKMVFYSELAYFSGLILLALGTAMMEKADFGMSMVVAPAFLLHLKISAYLPFFSFGMAGYCFQALLLVVLSTILRKLKMAFIFSFVTAIIFGMLLDFNIYLIGMLLDFGIAGRVLFYLFGMFVCSMGISLLFHTYITPEAYELFVKELSDKYCFSISKVKTAYDCASCLLGVILSFIFFGFGHFEGVKMGTIFCALVNGTLIGYCCKASDILFEFKDKFHLRRFFVL